MYNYKITVKGKGVKQGQGNTPIEAFNKLFTNIELVSTKNKNDASVCIELVGGKRKTIHYYIASTNQRNQNTTSIVDERVKIENDIKEFIKKYITVNKVADVQEEDDELWEWVKLPKEYSKDVCRYILKTDYTEKEDVWLRFYTNSDYTGIEVSNNVDSEYPASFKDLYSLIKKRLHKNKSEKDK